MGDNEKFNLRVVHDHLLTSLSDDDDVKLQEYILSYQELHRFFNLLGTIFGFVSKDLKSKTDILSVFVNDKESGVHFVTAKKMIEYEKSNNLLTKKGYVSGSRTLLRLHRGLNFIREFLKSVGDLKDSDNTSTVCREAYERTLAPYHTFVVRNAAKVAMQIMPNREQLLKKVIGEDENERQRALETLPKMLDVTKTVYDRIESLYTFNDLHSLP